MTAVFSARKALEMVRAGPQDFDLLITDLTMPHLTGLQLAALAAAASP